MSFSSECNQRRIPVRVGWHSSQSLRNTFGDSRHLERRPQRQIYCCKGSPRIRQHFKSWKVGSFKLSRGRSRGLPSAYPSLGKTGGKSKQLNDALKELFQTLLAQNISLCLQFVPSPLNQADALSRVLSDKDCMLAPEPWKELENLFGPHTFDLMALDTNAQIGCSGSPLPHFTPFPTPGSRGVNVFAQDLTSQENAYVFPPFILGWSSSPFSRQGLVLVHHCGSKTVSSTILVASYSSKGISFCRPGP